MANEGSVAPRERVNIVYKPATDGAAEEVELPLKVMMMGDYTKKEDDRALEDRKPIDVNKDNFNDVLMAQNLSLDLSVKDTISGESDASMAVSLEINSLKDFEPESVAQKVPELAALLELRTALQSLKGPLGNIPAFKKKIESLLSDDAAKEKLLGELGISQK